MGVAAVIEYYAFDAGRYCKEQARLVCKAFNRIGVRAWMQDITGWTKPATQQPEQPPKTIAPSHEAAQLAMMYYSNRSLDWYKATFCELLDLRDKVGTDRVIAQFSTRYNQQHTGATGLWLKWLEANYPQIYAHLHQSPQRHLSSSTTAVQPRVTNRFALHNQLVV